MIKIKKNSGVRNGEISGEVNATPTVRISGAIAELPEVPAANVGEYGQQTGDTGSETVATTGKKKGRFDFFPKRGRDTRDQPKREERMEQTNLREETKPRTGWISPKYTVSRSVDLDAQVLSDNRCIIHRAPDSLEVDAYRVLRTKILQKCKEKGGNTIMITSAVPGEGKTLNSINIAVTMAKEFQQTVLLVDCDLRRQSIHQYLGYPSDKGLIDYLLNDTPVSELLTWPGIEKLTVLSGGRSISGSSELLGCQRMKELVEDMKSRYPERYIIFDVPPLLAGADALAFIPFVDHVVVVVREGETPAPAINHAMKMIPPDKVLGLVLNGQKSLSNMVQYSIRRDYSA